MDRCEHLLNACRLGNLKDVQKSLQEGIPPDIQNAEGDSPLQVAAANGFTEIVSLLLKEGASIDLPNCYGWTPLMHAVRHSHTPTISLLLKMKAKVNVSSKLGMRPIDLATWNGQLLNLKLLIEAGAVIESISSNNFSNDCDFPPLMIASLQGHDIILRTLLEKGASVNQVFSMTGLTPLMLAACNGHKQIVQIIIEEGGDVNKTDICCQTALDLANACSQREVKAYLEDLTAAKCGSASTFQNTDILQAVRNGDISEVETKLQQNSSAANSFDPSDGITPLMLSSMLGYDNIVSILVSYGANLNDQDIANGWTALMYAVFHKHSNIVHILVDNGANVDICANNGYTALDLARHLDTSETDIVKTLIDAMPENTFHWNNYSSLTIDSNKRKSATSEKFSPRSPSQTRLKDWIGDVAQHFQQKVFIRPASKNSSTNIGNIEVQDCEDSMSDVFLENDSAPEVTEGPLLCASMLLSPNKHLAEALKEHIVEAITPPLSSGPTSYVDFMKDFSPRKFPRDKTQKPPLTSLQVPKLLKNRRKTYKGSQNKEQTVMSSPSERLEIEKNDSKRSAENPDIAPSLLVESENRTLASTMADGDLTTLLNKESLKECVQKFREQEIDFETFQYLTDEDLNEIGIPPRSHEKLMKIISKLQNT